MRHQMSEAAALLGKKYYQVHYAHRSGQVPEPERFNNSRVYGPDDLRRLAEYFGVPVPAAALHAPDGRGKATAGS